MTKNKIFQDKNLKKAFTMIEIIFVIVIIGILASVAIPRLAATHDDAKITKALITINAIRKSLVMERQKRMARGEFEPITAVGDTGNVFGTFKVGNSYLDTGTDVLEEAVPSEEKKYAWHWDGYSNGVFWYAFCLNDNCGSNSEAIWFMVRDEKFQCVDNPARNYGDCAILGIDSVPGW